MPDVIAATQDDAAQLNAEILEVLMGDIKGAVREGGSPNLLEIIDTSSATAGEGGVGMVLKSYQDSGNVAIYDIVTGEMSLTSANMLPAQLRKLNGEGKRMFTHRAPANPPAKGDLKCPLHPDHPDGRRAEYTKIGLPVCSKASLPNPYQVELHMKHRHPTAYETLDRLQKEKERAEEREWQRQIADAAVRGAIQPVAMEPAASQAPTSTSGLELSQVPLKDLASGAVVNGIPGGYKKGPFGRLVKIEA